MQAENSIYSDFAREGETISKFLKIAKMQKLIMTQKIRFGRAKEIEKTYPEGTASLLFWEHS